MLENPANYDLLSSYIIMERIFPPIIESLTVINGKHEKGNCTTEVGIFSSVLVRNDRLHSSNQEILVNETIGHLIRTKSESVNEAGVMSGKAAVDTLVIVDELKPVESSQTHFKPLYDI